MQELKDMYEKRINDLKNNLEGDSRKIREDYERMIKELKEKHEKDIQELRTNMTKEKEYAV
jgi:hypothetical protein